VTTLTFDRLFERLSAGEDLGADELTDLAPTHDILLLGTLGDVTRRRLHSDRVTYLRVALCAHDQPFVVPDAAREVRISTVPGTMDEAVRAVQTAKQAAGSRTLSAFSWADIERLTAGATVSLSEGLAALRAAGLDALTEIALDGVGNLEAAVEQLGGAGFERLRLTVEKAPAVERTELLLRASEVQRRHGIVHAINPLPTVVTPFQPTTGYDDVKAVAIARLAAPNIASIQVDWQRYGPKLAQVALTFGADDFDGVTASDEAPDGRRRAPLAEVRRGIEAAGFVPVERDGRFQVVS
jgi:aminodeoxyfutalosine synthase